MAEQIISTEFADVMQKSFVDYAMSVITSRAVPDVRDGLKPVQRRVLYAMHELGLNFDKPHRKSARIVGDTMGKYHPHGDSSIYEALVVMEQDFKKGMALVDGHGNFGSIEGDSAAAMRYTEARLKKFTQEVYLKDLDKNVINFLSNFDETEQEPEVLPVRVPNILVNGADGIAVGMVTSIPPHNLGEVILAVEAFIEKEEISTKELMEYIKGPDFPTGGIVINQSELEEIYRTGSGKIKVRGKLEFEPAKKKNERDKLVITEIPYTLIGSNLGKLLADIAGLVEAKKTTDIVDILNQSSKEGIRIVLELRKNADIEKLSNLLYKKTKLEDDINMIINKMWEEYELTPNQVGEYKKPDNVAFTQKKVNGLRTEIKELGSVNVDSIEEYKAMRERYDFMCEQRVDLEDTLSKLRKIITEMTTTMKEQFKKQFVIINQNFEEVFKELFGGGNASLKLEDEENILECGIDIHVQPPGKKLQNMMLLSGGEKAFTAIALLFAILKINPAPFCVLDEIEAALDDVNVYRFAEYLKKFSKDTQFLVITHRKGTMEAADTVYGVTMEENGISKLLSMKLG